MSFELDGIKIIKINRLVLEVVKKYIKENSDVKYINLKNIFPDSLQGSRGVLQDANALKNINIKDPEKRYFTKEALRLLDGTKVYVCSEWGDDTSQSKGNLQPFLEHVRNTLKYNIVELETIDLSVISRENILEAIKKYDYDQSICKDREAVAYDLIYDDKKYPHKCIVGIAYNIAIGKEGILESSKYQPAGSGKTSAKNILERWDFIVGKRGKQEMNTLRGKDKVKKKNENKILNQILYGPPGTGKTYNTINKALEIIFELEDKESVYEIDDKEYEISYLDAVKENDRNALNGIFRYYKDLGQIEFVTFHQSYGYEEFVEGKKARTINNEIQYNVEPGIFKNLCNQAKKSFTTNFTVDKEVQELTKELFKTLYDDFTNSLIDHMSRENSNLSLKTPREQPFDLYKNSTPSIVVKAGKERTSMSVSHMELEKVFFDNKSPIYKSYEKIIINKILGPLNYKVEETDNSNKNYILIIDEINRGNISKIFGELITLIEPSKRIGEEEQIMLTLANSPDAKFGVPSNLYIIGTMNTADRSIAQIDTALRRRFVFEEMMPKPKLLAFGNGKPLIIKDGIDEINVQEILTAINERIEYIHDREHTIGHSYFMPLIDTPTKNKLDDIFKVNIIPLLAEYFYGDWNDIIYVLNNKFIEPKANSKYITLRDGQLNKIYEIADEFETNEYLNIYNGLTKSKEPA